MAISFKEIQRSTPTKEQILEEMKRTRKSPRDMRKSYFYDGGARGEQAHFELPGRFEDEFEDVPF